MYPGVQETDGGPVVNGLKSIGASDIKLNNLHSLFIVQFEECEISKKLNKLSLYLEECCKIGFGVRSLGLQVNKK